MRKLWFIGIGAAGAALLMSAPARAAGDGLLHSSAFLTYQIGGEESVSQEGRALERISVFAYHLTEDGGALAPTSWVPDTVNRLVNQESRPVFVVVNNRMLDANGNPSPFQQGPETYAILADPQKRAQHIQRLVEIAQTADGLELNYERLPAEARETFTQFIQELRQALPAGKPLSVVLQPKTDNARGENGRAVDWRAIEPYVDYLPVMAYYYSFSTSPPGPVVPMETLQRLAAYTLSDPDQAIPREKLAIVLSMWGWDWPLNGTPGSLIQYADAMAIANAHGVTPERDPQEFTLHFDYTADDGVPHEIWIDDYESLRRRIWLLEAQGIPRINFWHLRTGDPKTWDYIERRTTQAGSVDPASTSASSGALGAALLLPLAGLLALRRGRRRGAP